MNGEHSEFRRMARSIADGAGTPSLLPVIEKKKEALGEGIDRLEYEYGILKQVKDYHAGRLETYTLDEVRAHCGLTD